MNPARHPELPGLSSSGAEIKAARGKTSSQQFEASARFYERIGERAECFAARYGRQIQNVETTATLLISRHPEQREEIEACARQLKEAAEIAKEQSMTDAQRNRADAQKHREHAEQARAFEARFLFNPYIDPFLDSVERLQREQEAKAEKRRSGPKLKVRAKR